MSGGWWLQIEGTEVFIMGAAPPWCCFRLRLVPAASLRVALLRLPCLPHQSTHQQPAIHRDDQAPGDKLYLMHRSVQRSHPNGPKFILRNNVAVSVFTAGLSLR